MNHCSGSVVDGNNRVISSWLKLDLRITSTQKDIHQERTPFKRIFLGEKHRGVYLTQREAECIYLLLKKLRRNQIAEKLNISVRTVDGYINSVRDKLNARNMQQLLELVQKTEFYNNYTKLIEEKF